MLLDTCSTLYSARHWAKWAAITATTTIMHKESMSLSSASDICSVHLCVSTFLIIHEIVSDLTVWITWWLSCRKDGATTSIMCGSTSGTLVLYSSGITAFIMRAFYKETLINKHWSLIRRLSGTASLLRWGICQDWRKVPDLAQDFICSGHEDMFILCSSDEIVCHCSFLLRSAFPASVWCQWKLRMRCLLFAHHETAGYSPQLCGCFLCLCRLGMQHRRCGVIS